MYKTDQTVVYAFNVITTKCHSPMTLFYSCHDPKPPNGKTPPKSPPQQLNDSIPSAADLAQAEAWGGMQIGRPRMLGVGRRMVRSRWLARARCGTAGRLV